MDNVRTNIDILEDLLYFVKEFAQYSGRKNTACHCHPEYIECCPTCFYTFGDHSPDYDENHKPDCRLAKLISETEAFIVVEKELEASSDKIDELI